MESNDRNRVCNHRCRYLRGNFLNIFVAVVVFTIYALNTFFLKPNFSAQFLHCYLNDLFAMPLILAYTNLLIYRVGEHSAAITTPARIGCLTLFCVDNLGGIRTNGSFLFNERPVGCGCLFDWQCLLFHDRFRKLSE